MKPTLLILAAGMGSRYGGMKQVDKFGPSGETIMEYSIFDAVRAGFGEIIIVTRKNIEKQLKDTITNNIKINIPLDFVFQELDNVPAGVKVPSEREKPWGTGHAVLVAEGKIQEPFAVINADDFYGFNAFKTLADFLSNIGDNNITDQYCLIGYNISNTLSEHGSVSRGVCQVDNEGNLTGIEEHTKIVIEEAKIIAKKDSGNIIFSGNEAVSMNMMGFSHHAFMYFNQLFLEFIENNFSNPKAEFYLPQVLDHVIKTGNAKVKVPPCPDKWFGVTYPEDKEMVIGNIQQLVSDGIYPSKLWE